MEGVYRLQKTEFVYKKGSLSCDAPQSGGLLTNHQHAKIPMDIVCLDITLLNPIYHDPFIYIQ